MISFLRHVLAYLSAIVTILLIVWRLTVGDEVVSTLGLGVLAGSLLLALLLGRRDPGGYEPFVLLSAGALLVAVVLGIRMTQVLASTGGSAAGEQPDWWVPTYAGLFGASTLFGLVGLVRIRLGRGARRGSWLAWNSVFLAPYWLWAMCLGVFVKDDAVSKPTLGSYYDGRPILFFILFTVVLLSALAMHATLRLRALQHSRVRLAAVLIIPLAWGSSVIQVIEGVRTSSMFEPWNFYAPLSTTGRFSLGQETENPDTGVLYLLGGRVVTFGHAFFFWDMWGPMPQGRAFLRENEGGESSPVPWPEAFREWIVESYEPQQPRLQVHSPPELPFAELAYAAGVLSEAPCAWDRFDLTVELEEEMPLDWVTWYSGYWPRFPHSGVIPIE